MEQKTLYCSFCGKSQHEVKKLVAGPTTFICNECIELCADIVTEEGCMSLERYVQHTASVLQLEKARTMTVGQLLGTAEDSGVFREMSLIGFLQLFRSLLQKQLEPDIERKRNEVSIDFERAQAELQQAESELEGAQSEQRQQGERVRQINTKVLQAQGRVDSARLKLEHARYHVKGVEKVT